jgi:hypothetical protein
MEIREPNFLRPVAPHRLKAYTVLLTVVGVVFVGTTIGLGTGLLSPSVTLDVTANLLFGLPVIVLPIVLRGGDPRRLQRYRTRRVWFVVQVRRRERALYDLARPRALCHLLSNQLPDLSLSLAFERLRAFLAVRADPSLTLPVAQS